MSQNIDFSALENISFNGSTVKTMVVDGETIWTKMASGDIYYVGQTVTIDGDPVVVTEINGTSVTGGGTTVDTSDPGTGAITTGNTTNQTGYSVGQTLWVDGVAKTIAGISGTVITFTDGSTLDTSNALGAVVTTTDPNANTTGNNVTNTASGGDYHSLYLKSDSSLWGVGNNSTGQLGDGTQDNRSSPLQIESSGVSSVAAGGGHSLYLKSDGSLWAMGWNGQGQLGIGTTDQQKSPVQVLDALGGNPVTNVVSVASGGNHSLYLKSDGSLWAMGRNNYGQLGDGTGTQRLSPVEIESSGVSSVAAGSHHSLYLKSDGSLWAMGWNGSGQLGDGTTISRSSPVQVLDAPGGDPVTNVVSVDANSSHSLYLKSDGSLWAMGDNMDGQLGDGTDMDRSSPGEIESSGVSSVAAGGEHSLYLKSDGSLWAMGRNNFGQLGTGNNLTRKSPVQVLDAEYGSPVTDVVSVFAGSRHSLFIKSDGTFWAIGGNSSGQLGDGTDMDRKSPVLVSI